MTDKRNGRVTVAKKGVKKVLDDQIYHDFYKHRAKIWGLIPADGGCYSTWRYLYKGLSSYRDGIGMQGFLLLLVDEQRKKVFFLEERVILNVLACLHVTIDDARIVLFL